MGGTTGTPISTNLSDLIPYVRLKIGDTNSASYRYLDAWIRTALIVAVKNLQRFWNYKYLVTDAGVVSRNPNATNFLFDEATYGVIQDSDQYIMVLMASIIILEGSLENSAWDAVSWRDNEISFSNLEQFRSRGSNIKLMVDELNSLIKSPTKRLAWTQRHSLPGFNPEGSSGYEKVGP